MIELISQHVMDILQADARLKMGGNAYAAGWPAVTREENGDTPTGGAINLFDKPYDMDGKGHRPAVYMGTRALEAADTLDFVTVSGGGRFEYRALTLPIVICVQSATKLAARKQRNQLRRNVKAILFDHIVASGYWYELTMPGGSGGMTSERVWTTATGGADQQVSEAMAQLVLNIRYSWNSGCDA